ncbi:hypothetical protein C8Q73DRAFT_796236 [Cubamyces lactineus]|nr:hypothetical protein C8Q73DRAFT_796236 [Cubamyces lactineus]
MSIVAPLLHQFGIPSLGTTFGPIYVGVTIGTMLYGLTVHQAYRYYKHYPEDGFFYPKGIVTCILTFETLHAIVWICLGYRYMVSEAFNVIGAISTHWTISITFVITPCSLYSCQVFYCYRIWHFGGKFRWLLIPAIVTMCVGITFSIVTAVKAFLVLKLVTDLDKLRWRVSVAYGCSAGSDIILAGTLLFTLLRIRKESRFRRTRTMLNSLIIYTINTGVLTRYCIRRAITAYSLFQDSARARKANEFIIAARLYANSVLALLNSRRYLNNRLQDDFSAINPIPVSDNAMQMALTSSSRRRVVSGGLPFQDTVMIGIAAISVASEQGNSDLETSPGDPRRRKQVDAAAGMQKNVKPPSARPGVHAVRVLGPFVHLSARSTALVSLQSMSPVSPYLHDFGILSFGTTLGSLYLGVTLGMMLYGLTVHQAYRYYKHYPEDGIFYPKGIVTLLMFFETLHTALWMYIGYRYLVIEAFNVGGSLSTHWTVSFTFILTPLSVHTCQAFYCCRIWHFGAAFYRWLLVPAVATICVGIVFAMFAGAKSFLVVREISDLDKLSWMVSVAYGCSGGSDITLAGIFVFTLLRIRKESKVRRSTDEVVDEVLYRRLKETNARLGSIVSFLAFLFAIVLPGNLIYACVSIVGSKLCTNSVLALLNSRRYLNNRLQDDFNWIDVSGINDAAQTPATPHPSARGATRGRACEEASTIVWASSQGSTITSAVGGDTSTSGASNVECNHV